MQDEHFMQSWNAGHIRFTEGLERGLDGVAERIARYRRKGAKNIRNPYGLPREVESPAALSPAAKASLRGLAASLATAALWLVVMALATPTPGLAAAQVTTLTDRACVASPLLA